MKKFLIPITLILFLACSKEEQEKIDSLRLTPPQWIHGTWTAKNQSAYESKLKFSPEGFFKFNEDNTELNVMSAYLLITGLTGEQIDVQEFNGSNFYGIRIVSETSGESHYDFTRISDNEISWDNSPPLNESELYIKN